MRILFFITFFISLNVFAQNKAEIERIVTSKNFYEVLNVAPNASEQEIRKAYRKLLSTYHPDKYATNEKIFNAANRVMRSLNEARDVLLDPLKRKAFDITAKATSTMKTSARASAKPNADAWQKHQFTDFSKESTAEAAPKGKAETRHEAKAEARTQSKPEPKSQNTDFVKTSSSTDVSKHEKAPLSSKAKHAMKMYGENNKACGPQNFVQAIVDEVI